MNHVELSGLIAEPVVAHKVNEQIVHAEFQLQTRHKNRAGEWQKERYREYAYTTGELGAATKTVGYTYGDSNWKDKVTAIDGKAITYDAIGNPLTYDGWTFSWKAGRLLTSMVNATINAQFTYDHNGLRVKKVVNGITTDYTLNGKLITHMTCGDNELHFFYDVQKRAAMVKYNNDDYFYVYDMQGNVVALIDKKGEQVVEYNYDAWGNQLEKTGKNWKHGGNAGKNKPV